MSKHCYLHFKDFLSYYTVKTLILKHKNEYFSRIKTESSITGNIQENQSHGRKMEQTHLLCYGQTLRTMSNTTKSNHLLFHLFHHRRWK